MQDTSEAIAFVKSWQSAFKAEHGRAPEKGDVASAVASDPRLKQAYQAVKASRPGQVPTPSAVLPPTPINDVQSVSARVPLADRLPLPVAPSLTVEPRAKKHFRSESTSHRRHYAVPQTLRVIPSKPACTVAATPITTRCSPSPDMMPSSSDPGKDSAQDNVRTLMKSAAPGLIISGSEKLLRPTKPVSDAALSNKPLPAPGRVETSDNFVVSDYRRKYRSKGVKKRRGVVRATNSAQMGDEYVGDGDERGLVMATEASIERNRARSASEGSQDEDEQEEEDTTGSASHADVDVLPVYVADMLRMEKAAGGGVRRFGGTGMNRSAVAPSGGTLSSSIDRAGADADALDVCIDAIEVATSITDVAVRSSERNPATGSSRSSSVMPPSHSTVPVLAEGHPVDGGRPSAAAKASAAVSAVTGLQYSDRGLPFCSGHRMECRARKVKKKGSNKGRWFFCCPCAPELSCGFFLWKDADARAAVMRFLGAAQRQAMLDTCASDSDSGVKSQQAPDPALMQKMMAEHRVRTTAASRWLDKARGVADLKAEVQRRGLTATPDITSRAALLAPAPRPGSKKAIKAAAPPGGYVAAAAAAEASKRVAPSLPAFERSAAAASGSCSSSSTSNEDSDDDDDDDDDVISSLRRPVSAHQANPTADTPSNDSPRRNEFSFSESSSDSDHGFRRRRQQSAHKPATKVRNSTVDLKRKRLATEAHVPISRLRRYELAALLIEDDVQVYRQQASERARKSSDLQHSVGEIDAVATNESSILSNSHEEITGDGAKSSLVRVAAERMGGAITSPPVLMSNLDTAMFTALRAVFGYRDFQGDCRRVDFRTLHTVAPSVDPSHTVEMTMQEWAVRRVLAGQSTLVVAATGVGKSLTYQLPAYLLATSSIAGLPEGITIVVSPLISLMRDQLLHLPRGLVGTCLSGRSTQGANDVASALMDLRDRRAHVLFVSPERLFSRAFVRLASGAQGIMPPVACVCIDEAHVVSEWSHNFRPVYMRLHALVRNILRPRCVLALTATATPSVIEGLVRSFDIPPGGVWVGSWRRHNLHFSSSVEVDRQRALVGLLRALEARGLPPSKVSQSTATASVLRPWGQGVPSTIVYVAAQADADGVANYLVSSGISAAAYHAGLGLMQRDRVYARFMSGGLHVVVATSAFGMGIDKNNIRCVVHYSLPRSIEDYVQQCGRAGRDGHRAHCHAFLDSGGDDVRHLHSLVASDVVDVSQVVGLLLGTRRRFESGQLSREKVMLRDVRACDDIARRDALETAMDDDTALCAAADAAEAMLNNTVSSAARAPEANAIAAPMHPLLGLPPVEVTLSFAQAQAALNLRPEVTETLLCFAESNELLRISGQRYATAELTFTSDFTPAQLAQHSDVVSAIATLSRRAVAAFASWQAKERVSHTKSGALGHSNALQRIQSEHGAAAPRKDQRGRTVLRVSIDAVVMQLQSAFVAAACSALSQDGGGTSGAIALRLQRICNHGHVVRELLQLQSDGRLIVSLSDWGVGVVQLRSWDTPTIVIDASASAPSPAAPSSAASSDVAIFPGLPPKKLAQWSLPSFLPQPLAKMAGPALTVVARSLHERMVAAARLGVTRLSLAFSLVSAAALSSWTLLWPGAESDLIDSTSYDKGEASTASVPETAYGSGWEAREGPLLHGIDSFCSGTSSHAIGNLSAAHATSASQMLPIRLVSRNDLPGLASDIRSTARRMQDVLRQYASEASAGVGTVDASYFFDRSDGVMEVAGAETAAAASRASATGALQSELRENRASFTSVREFPLINALSVARILHGVSSPLFGWAEFKPAGLGRSRLSMLYGGQGGLWGKYSDFGTLKDCHSGVYGDVMCDKFKWRYSTLILDDAVEQHERRVVRLGISAKQLGQAAALGD